VRGFRDVGFAIAVVKVQATLMEWIVITNYAASNSKTSMASLELPPGIPPTEWVGEVCGVNVS
jgi:hypothetical protein